MKNCKICILQTEWKVDATLNTYKKMTPGGQGVWKNMVTVPTIEEADVAIIVDYTIYDIPKHIKKIYIGAHPPDCAGYRCYDDKECIARFDLRDCPGFGEFWLDWTYDELMVLEPPTKTKNLSCILSNKRQMPEHNQRRKLVKEFCKDNHELIDVYGRIIPDQKEQAILKSHKGPLGEEHASTKAQQEGKHCNGKTSALLPYRFSLEFDYYTDCENYFSERVYDSLLLWAMPIYSGGKGLEKFLPKNSFVQIDSWKVTPEEILSYVNSSFREDNIDAIAEARQLLLNKYQLFPRVYEPIKEYFNLKEI